MSQCVPTDQTKWFLSTYVFGFPSLLAYKGVFKLTDINNRTLL